MDVPLDQQGYLNIPFGKAILRLTPIEYANAVRRGKAFLRQQKHLAREQALLAQQEAQALAWIGDDTGDPP